MQCGLQPESRLRGRLALVGLLLAGTLVTGACGRAELARRLAAQVPEACDDGWHVSSPSAEGLDAGLLGELTERIESGKHGRVHSCLIIKNGKLVYERYGQGYSRDTQHPLYSVTKSVTSALVGIAVDRGYIGSLDETVISYFPQYVGEDWDHRKDAITLEHLISMSSGLQYDEWSYAYSDPRNSYAAMTASDDWMEWALEQPVMAEPGTRFIYSSGNTHLLSGVLFQSTGRQASDFAEEVLFAPLGIADYYWMLGDGFTATSGAHGGLMLCARDMAKFGQMYLDGGRWEGRQVVPEAWVEASLTPRISALGWGQYGYGWWIHQLENALSTGRWFAARGYADQLIALLPSVETVVVFTCGNEEEGGDLDAAVELIARAAAG